MKDPDMISTIVAVFSVIAVYTVTIVGFGYWFSNLVNGIQTKFVAVLEEKHRENQLQFKAITIDHTNIEKRVSFLEWSKDHSTQPPPVKKS